MFNKINKIYAILNIYYFNPNYVLISFQFSKIADVLIIKKAKTKNLLKKILNSIYVFELSSFQTYKNNWIENNYSSKKSHKFIKK